MTDLKSSIASFRSCIRLLSLAFIDNLWAWNGGFWFWLFLYGFVSWKFGNFEFKSEVSYTIFFPCISTVLKHCTAREIFSKKYLFLFMLYVLLAGITGDRRWNFTIMITFKSFYIEDCPPPVLALYSSPRAYHQVSLVSIHLGLAPPFGIPTVYPQMILLSFDDE